MKARRAISQLKGRKNQSNIIAERLRRARDNHVPVFSAERLVQEILARQELNLDVGIVHKIENQLRGAQDYEVAAFAKALGVTSDWLLGLSEAGGPR